MSTKKIRCVENSEINDSNEKHEGTAIDCPHVAKCVDINSVKKTLKRKDEGSRQKKKTPMASKKLPHVDENVWICLKCGHTGSANSVEHFETPRSDLHAVVAVVNNWTARCILCPGEINVNNYVKLLNILEFLRKNFLGGAREAKNEGEEPSSSVAKEKRQPRPPPMVPSFRIRAGVAHVVQHYLPVLGLDNLGNTCYMNAILQCLAQTPGFISELEASAHNGGAFHLPGGDDVVKEIRELVPPLDGTLGEMGHLTKALIKLLNRVKNGEQLRKSGVVTENPGEVLRQMKKLVNTFYIGEQHDAHELLRLLLEGLKNEDLKRYQRGILNSLGIGPPNKEVSARDRELLIAYKKQAMLSELTVDKIFGGCLVSILKCMECGCVTTNFESFMDISLPVESEKFQPKAFDKPMISSENKMSKHQLKRERKLARKGKKKTKGGRTVLETVPQAISAKIRSSSDSASDSEADIEDNLDSETPVTSTQDEMAKNGSEVTSEIDQRLSETELSMVEFTSNSNEYSGSGVYFYTTEQSPSSPESGVVKGCSPDPTLIYECCQEPNVEDFGSCEGGRGSPASSIEQADWEEETSGKTDLGTLAKAVAKGLKISEECCPSLEQFELSEEDNMKESQWVDNSRDEVILAKSDFHMFPSRFEPNPSLMTVHSIDLDEIKNVEFNDPYINLEDEKDVKAQDGYDALDLEKGGISEPVKSGYNSFQSALTHEVNTKFSAADMGDMESNDNVWGITLAPLPVIDDQKYTVYNCLNQFFSKEVLSDSNRIGCLQCTKLKNGEEFNASCKPILANAVKQLLFVKLPQVLTLHLKRFEVFRTRMSKITRKVSFPMILDLSPYTSNQTLSAGPENPAKYELYGVVEHTGHMTSGHYVAYVHIKSNEEHTGQTIYNDLNKKVIPRTGELNSGHNVTEDHSKWYLISDTNIREITIKDVASAEAYLLFYKKI